MVRWGLAFLVLAFVGTCVLVIRGYRYGQDRQPLDEPLRALSGRTTTSYFSIPPNTQYDINLYVDGKVPYVDCFFGQEPRPGTWKCKGRTRVISISWALRDRKGTIIAHGISGGTCCMYIDDDSGPVVYTKIDGFSVPVRTTASLELKYNRNASILGAYQPRIAVEPNEIDSEAEGLEELLIIIGIVITAGIAATLLIISAVSARRERLSVRMTR